MSRGSCARQPCVSPGASRSRSTTQWLIACLSRLLFALFVSGGALPAGGPSAVHGFDIDKATTNSGTPVRAPRQAKRGREASSAYAVLEVSHLLASTHGVAPPQTWMRPRRMPLPDDDDDHTAHTA